MHRLGNMNQVTFCLRQLAQLDAKTDHKVTALHHALIYSFLTNYDKVHHILLVSAAVVFL